MSVAAHRQVKVKFADYNSFNLTGDQKLVEYLDQTDGGFYAQLTGGGTGYVVVGLDVLRGAIRKAKALGLDQDTVKHLKADLAAAKKDGEDSVTYDCF